MQFKCVQFLLIAFAATVSVDAAYADQMFPPINAEDCTEETALTWNGKGTDVHCSKVIRSNDRLGDPLLAKIVSTDNYQEYNQSIEQWITTSGSSRETIASWLQTCLVVDGMLPSTAINSPLNWEYCLRAFCKAKVGAQPFMTRMAEQCNEGGHVDCAGGHFYIAAQCLTIHQ